MAATATQLLTLSWSAARRRAWLLVPFVVGETLASLFMMIPSFVVLARGWKLAERDWTQLPWGLFEAVTEPRTLWTAGYALLFALVVGWLLRGLLRAGALGTLGQAVGSQAAEDDSAFSRAILDAPERWLASIGVIAVLRALTTLSIVGGVVAAMWFFASAPGVASAFVMTLACAMLLSGPLLGVALELAYARVVLLGEGPFDSVARAIEQAFRRRDALIPAWVTLVLVDVGLSFFAGVGSTLLQPPPEPSIQLLFLGPKAFVSIVFVALGAAVMLVRLGLYTALIAEDAGTIRIEPRRGRPRRPPPIPLPATPVFAAVPVEPRDEPL